MKILQLITTLDFGGAPRGVLELMSALACRGGIDQQLLVLSEDTQTYSASDLPEPPPRYLNYRLRHSDWSGIRRTAQQVREILQREQADVLHTHLLDADLIGALACQGTLCRHLSHIRGTSEWLVSTRWRDRLRRWFYRRTFLKAGTRFVAVSQTAADHTQVGLKIPADRIRVVLNGINPARFPIPKAPGLQPGGLIRIGSAGRFSAEKGYGDLIAAVGQLRTRCPQLRLVLAGQGGLKAEFEATIARLGLSELCQLIPPVEDMNSFLRGLDIFALPSHAEGLSRVLMEAMYCERPVVAARVSGSEESIVDHQTGLIYEPGDIEGLARQIERLVNSPTERQRLGQAAGEFASEKFTVDRVAAQVEAFYRELVPASSQTARGLA